MPKGIVTEVQSMETCPAPECKLLDEDVEQFVEELNGYAQMFEPAFQRHEQWTWGQVYLKGLLGDAPRKTAERIALELGKNVRDLQHFVGQSPWRPEPAVVIHQGLIAQTLGEADGVMLIDESGVVKQGQDSVGVAAQSGTFNIPIFPISETRFAFEKLREVYAVAGKSENCWLYEGQGGHRYYKAGAWPFIRQHFGSNEPVS